MQSWRVLADNQFSLRNIYGNYRNGTDGFHDDTNYFCFCYFINFSVYKLESMTTEQAIQKAMEKGYVPKAPYRETECHFTDHLFWQYLGKDMDWEGMKTPLQEYSRTGERMFQDTTRYHWHRFIDQLAEGKDAESFFETL